MPILRVGVDSQPEARNAGVVLVKGISLHRLRHRSPPLVTRLLGLWRRLQASRCLQNFPPNPQEVGVARRARPYLEGGPVEHVVHFAPVVPQNEDFLVGAGPAFARHALEAGFPFEAEVVLSQVEVGNRRFFQAVSFRHDRQDWYVCEDD